MLSTLRLTKFQSPKIGPTFLARPHLLRRLDAGLVNKVTLVSAPAGFGKSTLVSSWSNRLSRVTPQEGGPPRRTAWLSLDAEDNLLPQFTTYLVGAIESAYPQSCRGVLELLEHRPAPDIETLADLLSNSVSRLEDPLVLFLDDLHAITDASIYAFLTRLIEYAPAQVHLVLVSRVDPPLPLNRWRAQGSLNELRLHELAFTLEETAAFLNKHLDDAPTAALIETLYERTEGWEVGLWLAVLALRGRTDYAKFASDFVATSTRYIADYLVDEVLDHQSPPLQEFLISTALLNRFSSELCAAALEVDDADARRHIEYLERQNLFLIRLSSPPMWYRFHHQFRELLLSRLYMRYSRETIATLHRRAATWLSARDQVGEALRHLIAIADFEAAADLIEAHRIGALNQLRFLDLEGWLNQIPLNVLNKRLDLLLGLAWVRFDQVDNARCLAAVQRAESLLSEQAAALPERTRYLFDAELVALRTTLDRTTSQDQALVQIRKTWEQIRPSCCGHAPPRGATAWLHKPPPRRPGFGLGDRSDDA